MLPVFTPLRQAHRFEVNEGVANRAMHGLARGDFGPVVLAPLSVDAIEGSGICGYPDQTRPQYMGPISPQILGPHYVGDSWSLAYSSKGYGVLLPSELK